MKAPLTCARCGRPLKRAAATIADMPLGRTCARLVLAEAGQAPDPRRTPAERAAEAAFRARQLSLIETQ